MPNLPTVLLTMALIEFPFTIIVPTIGNGTFIKLEQPFDWIGLQN